MKGRMVIAAVAGGGGSCVVGAGWCAPERVPPLAHLPKRSRDVQVAWDVVREPGVW